MTEPRNIPYWLTIEDEIMPCPCGRDKQDRWVLVYTDDDQWIRFHYTCLQRMRVD